MGKWQLDMTDEASLDVSAVWQKPKQCGFFLLETMCLYLNCWYKEKAFWKLPQLGK